MKASYAWILLGVAIAVILYLVFRPIPVINNKDLIRKVDSLGNDNTLLRKSLAAEFFNFSHFKDSSTKVIDSLLGRNRAIKQVVTGLQKDKADLANQILNRKPNESIDSPCIELARKVISDSLIITDYQKNNELLISGFSNMIGKRDSLITHQQKLILSDSILIAQQKDLYTLQEKQLKSVQRQGKTSAWLARSLAVVALVLGGILLGK